MNQSTTLLNRRALRVKENESDEGNPLGINDDNKQNYKSPAHKKSSKWSLRNSRPIIFLLMAVLLIFGRIFVVIYLPELRIPYKSLQEQQDHALWKGQVVAGATPIFTQRNIDLVVSHCKLPLDWIWNDFAPGTPMLLYAFCC